MAANPFPDHAHGVPLADLDSIPGLETVVVTPFEQNCSVLFDPATRRGAVIDPGGDVARIMSRIGELGVTVEAVLLTHGHLDHAGGAEELRRALPPAPGGQPIQVIGPDRRDEFLLSNISRQAAAYGVTGLHDAFPDRWLTSGETLAFAGRALEVLFVPGHTPGHVAFFDRNGRLLIGGDTLFAGSVGRTDLPQGDGPLLVRSIRAALLPLGDAVTVIPGHGPRTRIGDERRGNPFLQ
ncbi:MBL fold metallo-hydrolase [Lichenicoccus sp.]|uniref:MBL fold metallo-hydrolase n=1 Tax=Lichenicoccus sp. TaxID=2781899 RepID=UPI003D0C668A